MKIEKGIPIPPRGGRKTPLHATHLAQLEVGDSVAFDIPEEYQSKPSVWADTNRIRNAAYAYGKRAGRSFTVRFDDNNTRIRIWRTA